MDESVRAPRVVDEIASAGSPGIQDICVGPTATIRGTLERIDRGARGIALVVDSAGRLICTVTDGDIRRAVLRGMPLETPVQQVIADPACRPPRDPVKALQGTTREQLCRLMKQHKVGHVVIVDKVNRVVGLERLTNPPSETGGLDNPVVLMAGGLGLRLRPLTAQRPKPLLHVGGRPILELLIEHMAGYGYQQFLVSVGYRARQIIDLLGDGQRFGVQIRYLRERSPSGTAGALRMARPWIRGPFLVVNGDLVTTTNFRHLLDFHLSSEADVTVAVKEHVEQSAFGVVELRDGMVVALNEKPVRSYYLNAGMYVLEPHLLDLVPPVGPIDMPELILRALEHRNRVVGFALRESWIDVGRPDDYLRVSGEFPRLAETAG